MTELEQLIKEFQKKQSAGKVLHNDMRGLPGENAPVVVNVAIVNNQLIFRFSDGKEFNAGILPLPLHGNDGVDGNDGEDGISASNIEEISIKDNNLIITFDDGREINAGSLHKPQDGIAGVGVENVEVRDNKFVFTFSDGKEITAGEIRVPSDGVGVQNVQLVRNELLVTLTNGKVINAGNVPLPEKGVGIDKIYPSGNDVIAELTDGRKFSVGSMPKPVEGVGIRDLNIEDGRLNVVLTDGSTVDAGELPKQDAVPLLPVNNIISAEIDAGRLIFTTENGEKIDAGELPVERVMSGGVTGAFVYEVVNNAVISIANLTVANFASPNVSQWTNDAGYITSSSLTGYVPYTGATTNLNLGANTITAANFSGNSSGTNTGDQTITLTGDVTGSGMGSFATTLATVNSTIGSFGSSNVIPTITVNAKGLITAVNSNSVVAPAGTLTGSTLASGVTASSLTSFGNSPSFVTPLLGTPTSGVLTNCTGLPLTTGITGILPIANGGTNTNTQTSFGMCYFDGTKLTTSPYATMSFIAGDIDLLITHPSVTGTVYEVLVTSSSCQYIMSYNTASTFQGICGTAATENYWTLSTKGLGLSVSAVALWFGSTSNDDMSFYRNNTERLRLTTTGIYVPDVAYLSAASPTINAMVTGTTLIQSSVRLISAYAGAASANSSYFLGSGNDGGLLQVFGAGGTIASPTALTTDSRMGGVFGRGYAATGYSNAVTAVTFHAETTFTDTSTPTYIAFATTATGATTRTEAMRITSAGNLLLGTTSTSARITLGGSPVMQTLIRNDATLTASGNNADQYGFINYNNMTFTGGSANYATGHYADLKVNVPGGATVVYATSIIAVAPTNLGAGSVTHAKALRATAPTVGTASNVAAALTNVSIGGSYVDTTPPADGAIIQGKVGIGTTNPGAALDVKSNGGTINLTGADHTYIQFYPDGAAAGRKGYLGYPSAGNDDIYIANEISGADVILLPNGGNVGIGTTGPTTKLNIKESGTNNAVVFIEPGTWAPGYYGEIRFGDANHYIRGEFGAGINIYDVNRIALTGSDVIIGGLSTPRAKLEVVGDIWTDWNDRFIGTVYQAGAAYKMGIGTTTGVRALDLIAMSADSSAIRFWTGTTPSVNAYIDHVSNVVLGNQSALATNATNGFVYIRTCAGTPTGAPTAFTGHVAMLYDTTNNKLYCYNGAWKSVTLT